MESTVTADVAIQCKLSSTLDMSIQCSLQSTVFDIAQFCKTLTCCFEFLGEAAHNLSYWYGRRTKQYEADNRGGTRALTPLNELFSVLCRLCLRLLEQDLAYQFAISQSTMSRICVTWINFLYVKLKEIPIWPSREQVNENMPICFKESYPSTRCIIDATEIYIQQPLSPVAQQATLKAIIGYYTFRCSQLHQQIVWGQDKKLTIQCGILNLLEQGDSVMADRGFMIADLLSARGVDLNVPPSKLQPQLTEGELIETRRIASVRIHVERAIGRLKNYVSHPRQCSKLHGFNSK